MLDSFIINFANISSSAKIAYFCTTCVGFISNSRLPRLRDPSPLRNGLPERERVGESGLGTEPSLCRSTNAFFLLSSILNAPFTLSNIQSSSTYSSSTFSKIESFWSCCLCSSSYFCRSYCCFISSSSWSLFFLYSSRIAFFFAILSSIKSF